MKLTSLRKSTLASNALRRGEHAYCTGLIFLIEGYKRKYVAILRSQIEPIRMSLLSNLAYMFPIELLSPPDLLFTILDVPLPIPVGETDPAPPLLLQSFPEVSEDSVATALGYAALVVHLMATYLCRTLVYPITYIGSRSLIKDPISAMMGPRMYVSFALLAVVCRKIASAALLNRAFLGFPFIRRA